MKPEIAFFGEALQILCPNGFTFSGTDIKAKSDPVPSQEEVDAKIAELKTEYATQEYARNRAIEYPSITDVTVALAEKAEGSSTMWDKITAQRMVVKNKYSKP